MITSQKLITVFMAFFFMSVCFAKTTSNYDDEISLTPVKLSYFGMHFHRLVLSNDEVANNYLQTVWPKQQIGSVRLWDSRTRWADVAPEPGKWDYERMDSYVEQAVNHNASIVYTFGSTPDWASARKEEKCPYGFGCSSEPIRMAHWVEYVRNISRRYKGKIEYYEIWNEPKFSNIPELQGKIPFSFFTGSVENMVEMARLARETLKEEDPNSKLLTPGFDLPEMLDLFLKSGGKKYIDIISFHFYAGSSMEFSEKVAKVRAIMSANGVSKLPLWNTESGFFVQDGDNILGGSNIKKRKLSASLMAQSLIMGASLGIDRFYYYSWDNERSGMVTKFGEHLPAYDAIAKVQKWLIGAKMTKCEFLDDRVLSCAGVKHNKHFKIVWADHTTSKEIPMPYGYNFSGQEHLFSGSKDTFKYSSKNLVGMISDEPTLLWFN